MSELLVDDASRVAPLAGAEYREFLIDAIDRARQRVWANIFIVDVRLYEDPELRVREVLEALERAQWRRVDVRVMVSPSDTQDIYAANVTTLEYLAMKGVPARLYRSGQRGSSHSKLVVVDDELVIVGSHNWTHRAFTRNIEQSLALESRGVNIELSRDFAALWSAADDDGGEP